MAFWRTRQKEQIDSSSVYTRRSREGEEQLGMDQGYLIEVATMNDPKLGKRKADKVGLDQVSQQITHAIEKGQALRVLKSNFNTNKEMHQSTRASR